MSLACCVQVDQANLKANSANKTSHRRKVQEACGRNKCHSFRKTLAKIHLPVLFYFPSQLENAI